MPDARCDVMFHLGLPRYRLREADAAIVAFQSAAQCDPKLLPAPPALAEAYLERKRGRRTRGLYTHPGDRFGKWHGTVWSGHTVWASVLRNHLEKV